MAVPNQKFITIRKLPHSSPDELCIRNADLGAAARTLSHSALRVWLWFCSHSTGDEFELKPSDICDEMGVSLTSYKNAINELIEKNYLIPNGRKRKPNAYIFRDSLTRIVD